jgi:hypothetical protein
MKSWDPKDPDEILDYHVDWSERLDTDTIDTSTWDVPSGITKMTDSTTTTISTIWLSGGTIGESYIFTNHINTAGGREMDQSVKLKVKSK